MNEATFSSELKKNFISIKAFDMKYFKCNRGWSDENLRKE